MIHYIKAKISPGMFSSERAVSFSVGGVNYNLFADERCVSGDEMSVTLVGYTNGYAVVDLPGEPISSGSRVRIPAEMVLERVEEICE
jgi:hypothetical protein